MTVLQSKTPKGMPASTRRAVCLVSTDMSLHLDARELCTVQQVAIDVLLLGVGTGLVVVAPNRRGRDVQMEYVRAWDGGEEQRRRCWPSRVQCMILALLRACLLFGVSRLNRSA